LKEQNNGDRRGLAIHHGVTHVQKRRHGVAMYVDHLQVGQTVDASHAQAHDAQYERER